MSALLLVVGVVVGAVVGGDVVTVGVVGADGVACYCGLVVVSLVMM